MTQNKFTVLLLGSGISWYAARIIHGYLCKHRQKGIDQRAAINEPESTAGIQINHEVKTDIHTGRSILKTLFAYDNSDHKTLMHVRFDQQTVDTLNKFKLATGVDMTKFVAFAVRHLLDTHPDFKTIIYKYLQRTEL